MRLFLPLLIELVIAGGGGRGNSPYGRAGDTANGESLTVGNVRPNKNVDTLNNLNYIGCGLSQINEKNLMAVSNQFFNSYSNCGRCAKVTCVGKICPQDATGKVNSVIAQIVTQTTQSDNHMDIELNGAAWGELMGQKSKVLPGMTINWQFVACEDHGRRQKFYVRPDSNAKLFKIQPVNFNDKIKWIKIKSGAPGAKYLKAKDPIKAKADAFYFAGKIKGPQIVAPVSLYMQLDDGKKTKLKVQMTSWGLGEYSYIDGLPPPENENDGPTQTKHDTMNVEVLSDLFVSSTQRTTTTRKPAVVRPTRVTTTRRPRPSKRPRPPKKVRPPKKTGAIRPPAKQPPRVQQSAIRDNIDMFVEDLLSPFLFGAPPPPPTRRTTTTERTTVKQHIGGGKPQTLTGFGAPGGPSGGSCGIKPSINSQIYVSINRAHAKRPVCGKCVFIWCPSFGGCKGSPLQKAEIIDVYDGKADIAMSKEVFKIVVGAYPTKTTQKSIFMGMWNIVSC